MSIYSDIRTALINDREISTILKDCIYSRQPISQKNYPYANVILDSKSKQISNDDFIVRIFVFHDDLDLLECVSESIIDLLIDNTSFGYFKISLVSQLDNQIRLANGYYYNILTFDLKKTS